MLVGVILEDGENCVLFKDIPDDVFSPELKLAIVSENRDDSLHVSDLVNCPYLAVKQRLTDYYIPIKSAYRMIRGKAWDCLSQKYARSSESLYQCTLSCIINNVNIIGTPDVIDLQRGTIEDFKSPSQKFSSLPNQYLLQLNSYYYMWACGEWNPSDDEDYRYVSNRRLKYSKVKINKLILNNCSPTFPQIIEIPKLPLKEIKEILEDRLCLYMNLYKQRFIGRCTNPLCYNCKQKMIYSIIGEGNTLYGQS